MNMKNYLLYARKSSESEDRQAASVESQIHELENSIAKILQGSIRKPYFTESMSAKKPGRTEFNKMMDEIESGQNGQINGILCWKLNRLARNPIDGGRIIWAVTQLGVEIITPSKTYTTTDLLLMYVEFGMANQFISDLTKDTKRGLKNKAEHGWLPSGAKAGYANDKFAEKGSKTLLPDPERFPIVRKMWDHMLTGTYTVMQLLRLLNEEWGYRTPKHKRIGGKPMSRSQIYKTLTDPFYYGKFEYPLGSGTWYDGKHQKMITEDEFNKVQMLLGRKGRPRPRSRSFDYTGLLNCGECGAAITAEEKFQIICPECKQKFASQNKSCCPKCQIQIDQMKSPKLLHYVYYHCTKRKNPDCSQGSMRVEDLENKIDNLLSKIQISERFQEWAFTYINELNDKESVENESILHSLQMARADCETRLNNLLKMKISPQNADGELLNDADYRKQKDLLEKERDDINRKLQGNEYQADNWRTSAEKTFDFACHARHNFETGSVQVKRELLARLGSNLRIKDKNVLVDLEKPLHFIEMTIDEAPSISAMFEPEEMGFKSTQLEALWSKNLSVLPR